MSAKKMPADRRIMAKAKREQESGTFPAAERVDAPTPAPKPPEETPEWSREGMADWSAKRKAVEALPLTITLAEACDLVGRDLSPTAFQEQVFDVIARELDTLSDLAERSKGFESWAAMQNLCSRIQLAGKIAAVIGGAS